MDGEGSEPLGLNLIQSIEDVVSLDVSAIRNGERLYFTGIEALVLLATGAASTLLHSFLEKFGAEIGISLGKQTVEKLKTGFNKIRLHCARDIQQYPPDDMTSIERERDLLLRTICETPSFQVILAGIRKETARSTLEDNLTAYFIECGISQRRSRDIAKRVMKRLLDESK